MLLLLPFLLLDVVYSAVAIPSAVSEHHERRSIGDIVIAWTGIHVTQGNGIKKRNILNIGPGSVQSGRLMGILGPSGSGKSTFLNVIARRRGPSGTGALNVHANIVTQEKKTHGLENRGTLEPREVAFVHQEDLFFDMLSVKETLELSHQLKEVRTPTLFAHSHFR